MKNSLGIIAPCYNEEKNLDEIFNKITTITNKVNSHKHEFILVDNGSTDASYQKMISKKNDAGLNGLKIVQVKKNKGYGHGILEGLRHASGTFLSWTHADLQTDIMDVFSGYEKMISSGKSDLTFIKGKRKNRNPLDTFFTICMSFFSSIMLKTWLEDVNAQPKIFPRSFYNLMENPPLDFSLDLYVLQLAKKHGFKIETIPVIFPKRIHGEAKGGGSLKTKITLIKRTIIYIFKLRSLINDKK